MWEKKEPPQHPRSPNRHNVPHPYYAKFIENDSRFFNEPICHMETANTMSEQALWWAKDIPSTMPYMAPYDTQTTQRRDYQETPSIMSSITRHSMNPNKFPVCGIAPLAVPKTKSTLPKILQEQISFQHQYDSRTSPNEPIRGKRHGAFVWTEIKPVSGPMAPKGIKVFLSAVGSRPPEQPKNEKGSLVEGCVTSPNLCLQNSQQMFDSESHLSKTDLGEAAKIYPRIPAGGQNSSSLSQPAEEDAGHHAREEAFCSATSHPLGDPRGRFPPTIAMSMVLPAPTAVDMKPSVIAQVITLVPPGIHNTRHKLTPMNC
ncbi:uncharacterized protein C2orf73 homolog isoform X3 [Rhinatrema bivittatum]|nr:uncharacterized protein C2orf73 homolog isoform X3 [Rhinatrema bivittatum]